MFFLRSLRCSHSFASLKLGTQSTSHAFMPNSVDAYFEGHLLVPIKLGVISVSKVAIAYHRDCYTSITFASFSSSQNVSALRRHQDNITFRLPYESLP
jgi:hypothetical protein